MAKISFQRCSDLSEIKKIYQFDVEAFAAIDDQNWKLENLEVDFKSGWEFYSAKLGDEVVAALFVKKKGGGFYTRHTGVKLDHQGKGISHEIKNYIEELAVSEKSSNIFNFCHPENFRNISLNETHGYAPSSKSPVLPSGSYSVWKKKI